MKIKYFLTAIAVVQLGFLWQKLWANHTLTWPDTLTPLFVGILIAYLWWVIKEIEKTKKR